MLFAGLGDWALHALPAGPFSGDESTEKQKLKVNGTAHHIVLFCWFFASIFKYSTLKHDKPFYAR